MIVERFEKRLCGCKRKQLFAGGRSRYPNLYNIVRRKHATIACVLNTTPLNVSFRRSVIGNKLLEWLNLVSDVSHVILQRGRDKFQLGLHKIIYF